MSEGPIFKISKIATNNYQGLDLSQAEGAWSSWDLVHNFIHCDRYISLYFEVLWILRTTTYPLMWWAYELLIIQFSVETKIDGEKMINAEKHFKNPRIFL